MVTLNSADGALKSFYLDAVKEALDVKANPFFAQIEKSTSYVTGKDVKKLVRNGIHGGMMAGTETGDLSNGNSAKYTQFVATLKNLYGTIEISDKALRAAQSNEGAFVNLLNEEMDSLVDSAKINFSRMLFGDGSGKVGHVVSVGENGVYYLKDASAIVEGMRVDVYDEAQELSDDGVGATVIEVDYDAKTVKLDRMIGSAEEGYALYAANSRGNELGGLGAIFSQNELYGQARDTAFMKPFTLDMSKTITVADVEKSIDSLERKNGGKINLIICSYGVKRALEADMRANRDGVSTMKTDTGFTALSFNGIPVVADRFCPSGTMYLLNTDDFKLHQLCDWQWMEAEDGKILKQVPGKPIYSATLVKYAELMCERPCAQGMIYNITE